MTTITPTKVIPPGEATPGYRTPEEWARVVRGDLSRSVGGIIDAGRHLTTAKDEIGHGEFRSWIDRELKISHRTVDYFMAIAANAALTDSQHVASLPAQWGTLKELAAIPEAKLTKAIESGKVTPAMERKDASELRKKIVPPKAKKDAKATSPDADSEAPTKTETAEPKRDSRKFTDALSELEGVTEELRQWQEIPGDAKAMTDAYAILTEAREAITKLFGSVGKPKPAKPASAKPKSSATARDTAEREHKAAIRAWWRSQGHKVSDRGALPKAAVAEYEAAHAA